nr:hypothetical protein KPHV_07870 [Kitasatospora purpeofusca]
MAENPIADTGPRRLRVAQEWPVTARAAGGRSRAARGGGEPPPRAGPRPDYGCSMTSSSVPGTNFRLTEVDWTNTV